MPPCSYPTNTPSKPVVASGWRFFIVHTYCRARSLSMPSGAAPSADDDESSSPESIAAAIESIMRYGRAMNSASCSLMVLPYESSNDCASADATTSATTTTTRRAKEERRWWCMMVNLEPVRAERRERVLDKRVRGQVKARTSALSR